MIVTYVVLSSCDDNGDLLAGGARVLDRFTDRTVAERFVREALELYQRKGVPIGIGCLWIEEWKGP